MYGRKLKVKKKTKPGLKSNDGGSNWGPRIALYEREREAATQQLYVKQVVVQQHQAHNLTSSSASNNSSSAITYTSHYGQQQQQEGKYSSSSINGSNGGAGTGKPNSNNNAGSSSTVPMVSHDDSNETEYYYHQQRGVLANNPHHPHPPTAPPAPPRPSVTKRSSSNKSSSGGGSTNKEQMSGNLSKPLKVIIPPPEHFVLESDFGPDRHSSVPSTKTWRSSPGQTPQQQQQQQQEADHEEKNSDHRKVKGIGGTTTTAYGIPPPPEFAIPTSSSFLYSRGGMMMRGKIPESGKLLVKADVERPPSSTTTERYGLRSQMRSSDHLIIESGRPEKVNGAAITALAQGLAMVYVPMEAIPPHPSNVNNNHPGPSRSSSSSGKSAEQIAVDNLDEMIESSMSSHSPGYSSTYSITHEDDDDDEEEEDDDGRGDGSNKPLLEPSRSSSNSAPFGTEKDSEIDSLLESFDSVMFKPKGLPKGKLLVTNSSSPRGSPRGAAARDDEAPTTSSPSSRSDSSNKTYDTKELDHNSAAAGGGAAAAAGRVKQQISESPPPLPPPNSTHVSSSNNSKPKRPDKNLRFSEQLENISRSSSITHNNTTTATAGTSLFHKPKLPRLGKKVAIPTTPLLETQSQHSQQDTQSVTTEVMDLKHFNNQHHHPHGPSTTISESSFPTVLSCGHMRTSSNYSTLSSITSSLTDEEPPHHNNNNKNHNNNNHHNSNSSGSESNNSNKKNDTRSAIQQLRDLSILIGSGGGHPEGTLSQLPMINNNNKESSKLLKCEKLRRDSQGSSGTTDSGKGSGSGQSPTENSSSPKGMKALSCSFTGLSAISTTASCAFSMKSAGSSNVNNNHGCEDCYKVFKNPLAIDSSCSHSSGTSPLSSQDRCENYHRHLIIQEQSRHNSNNSISNGSKHSSGKMSRTISSSHGSQAGSTTTSGSLLGLKKSKKSKKHKKTHQLVFEYCDCRHCDCSAHRDSLPQLQQQQQQHQPPPNLLNNKRISQGLLLEKTPIITTTAATITTTTNVRNDPNSGLMNGINPNNPNNGNIRNKRSPGNNSSSGNESLHNSHLFTIDEEELGEVVDFMEPLNGHPNNNKNKIPAFMNSPDLNSPHDDDDDERDHPDKDHWHPKRWLATDATMGWSDLESLYSQNMKLEQPANINDECWTCWKELAESRHKFPGPDANRTVDRTKRMFIWLNKRHKEFNAPWWEAKKQASIRWLITKAFAHLPREEIEDPFKESKKGKPKYRLKDEVIKGLVNGKLYCLALDHLYQNQHYRSGGLTHWDIIKILSRRGVYVAQPSDMKLTEGTLRQKKPLRIAAHIALIEAIMGLYCKETLNRDRIVATLNSFGHSIDPENSNAEQLLIAWINAAILTLKSYIINNAKTQKLPCGRLNRWLNVPQVHEIRDLCDGVGVCSLFALYCSSDIQVSEIAVPEPDDMLNIYETIANHSIIERLCHDLLPETVYHLRITDFLYIHGYMKQNILCFLVDLFNHLEINPVVRVNRLTHVPIRIEL